VSNVLKLTKLKGAKIVNDYENNQDTWLGKCFAPACGEYMRHNGAKLKVSVPTGEIWFYHPDYKAPKKKKIVALARANFINHDLPGNPNERITDSMHQINKWLPSPEKGQKEYCVNSANQMLKYLKKTNYSDVIEFV